MDHACVDTSSASGLTIHSSRRHFVARLNSGVRAQMRHLYLLPILLLVASCASSQMGRDHSQVLAGVFGVRDCSSSDYYSGSYPTLLLDAPMVVPGVGQVGSVELILNEPEFVRYQLLVDKRGSVNCSTLQASNLCGPAVTRASCGVSRVSVAP